MLPERALAYDECDQVPVKMLRADYSTPVKLPPKPVPRQEPVETQRHYVRAEIRPSSENDPGAIIEGRYAASDSLVRVWDMQGNLLGTEAFKPGDDAERVARKLLRAKRTGFYDALPYPRGHVV